MGVFPIPSETFKPIEVGADGATAYFNEQIISVYLDNRPGAITYTSGGETITDTAQVHTFTSDPLTLQGKSRRSLPLS